jgi:hypothetical protein
MRETMQRLLHTFAALADLSQEIANTSDFEEMVRTSLHLLLGTLAIRRGAVAEYNRSRQALKFIAARGLGDARPKDLPLETEDVESLPCIRFFGLTAEEEASISFVARHQAFLCAQRLDLMVPLAVRGELVGLVLLGEKASGEPFTVDDRDVICSMARHIGVGIHTHRLLEELEHKAEENRQLYDGMRAIYKDTVRAFAAAIDGKDKYTHGHSERVGKYSEIIAREMGWSEEEVEGIAVAGYLHDVGKLVVERDILNAPYKIDAQKSSELNRHPAAGYEMLTPIHHHYADISLIARHHHERIDGRGYPDGLKGEQIPIGAKVVTLADSFDAMTTDRPYKTRRSLEDVIDDLRRSTGKQFAPEVVTSFCRALLKEVSGETRTRPITKMLGKGYIDAERVAPLLIELIADLESGASDDKEGGGRKDERAMAQSE